MTSQPAVGVRPLTRYLAAAAHSEPGFARAVIDELVAEPSRGVAPAAGADLPTVVRHCLDAARRELNRDLALGAVLIAVSLATGLRGLLIVLWLCSSTLLSRPAGAWSRPAARRAASRVGLFLLISLGCGLGLLITSRSGLLPGLVGSTLLPLGSGTLVVLTLLALWMVTYLARVNRFAVLDTLRDRPPAPATAPSAAAPSAAAPAGRPGDAGRLTYLAGAQESALSVYSTTAATAPFVGYGPVQHAWSAGCPIGAGLRAPAGPELAADGVYEAIRAAFEAVAGGAASGRVMAAGRLSPADPLIEAGPPPRPAVAVPAGLLADAALDVGGAGGTAMFYLAARLQPPGLGPCVTGFVHVQAPPGRLWVEVAITVLPGLPEAFRDVDVLPPAGPALLVQLLAAGALDAFRLTPRAPGNLIRQARRSLVAALRQGAAGPAGRVREGTDFGSRAGLRELAARARTDPPRTDPPGTDPPGTGSRGTDFETVREVNRVSRTIAEAITGLLLARGLDPAEFTRAADRVWQQAYAAGGAG